jgi:RHS repeat-associated protein
VTGGGTTSTTITWDADSQRVKLARGSNTWEMIYDPAAGNPAVLVAKNYVSSATTYMFYVREPRGGLLASFDAAETQNKYYYHFDDLGSAVLVTNGSGTASDSSTYGAWGAVLASQNNLRPYQYVGELGYYRHSSTQGTALANLLQLGVRFYDPDIGRFTQGDPVRQGLSLYAYCADNPLRYVDPRGLACRPSGVFFWDPLSQRWAQRQVCTMVTMVSRNPGWVASTGETYDQCMSRVNKNALTALLGMMGAISIPEDIALLGCVATGPLFLECATTVAIIFESTLLVSIGLITASWIQGRRECDKLPH